jgi:hypothetical protein
MTLMLRTRGRRKARAGCTARRNDPAESMEMTRSLLSGIMAGQKALG